MTRREVILLLVALFETVAALRCYSCSFSYNEMYDDDHRDSWCANESLVLFDKLETSKDCAPWEKFCVTSVLTINNAFTSVSRDCGERCNEFCESVGYGQDQRNGGFGGGTSTMKTEWRWTAMGRKPSPRVCKQMGAWVSCEECCDSDMCNNKFSVQFYQEMMGKQFTGWTRPLPGEREWNKKSGLRFPY